MGASLQASNQPVGQGTAIMPHPLRGWQAPFLVGDALEVPPIPPAFCLPRLSREIDISLYKDNPAGAWQNLAEPKDICVDVRYPGKSFGGASYISKSSIRYRWQLISTFDPKSTNAPAILRWCLPKNGRCSSSAGTDAQQDINKSSKKIKPCRDGNQKLLSPKH